MKHFLYYTGLSLIAIVLFILHTAFAYSLFPIFLAEKYFKDLFVLLNGFDLKVYIPYAIGLTFAIAIVAIMDILHKTDKNFWKFAIAVATMELIGIALLCFPFHEFIWLAISGFYYGIYFFLSIIFYFYVKPDKQSDSEVIAKPMNNALQDDSIQWNWKLRNNKPVLNEVAKARVEFTQNVNKKIKEANHSLMLEKIKNMYLQGIDYKIIAKEVSRDKTTVFKIINKYKTDWNVR